MPVRYVLDASAGVDILERTDAGRAVVSVLRQSPAGADAELWTVEHFHLEVARVIRRDVIAGVLDDRQATHLVDALVDWPLTVVSVAPLLVDAWNLRHNLTIHDALYVVLTRRLGDATLVTSDGRLSHAPGVDVPVRTPDQLRGPD